MKKIKISGGMLVFLGALFWSLNAPLIKFIDTDALLTCGFRSVIAGLFLLPFLRPKKLNISPWLLVHLLAYCGLCVSIVLDLRQTSAAIAIGMQYGSIVWLFLAGLIVTWRSSGSSCERRDEMRKALGWDKVLPVFLYSYSFPRNLRMCWLLTARIG